MATPRPVVILDTVDSTNAEARRQAEAGIFDTWIVARQQTAGRGRDGRAWETGAGNLAASIALTPEGTPAEIATYSFEAGIAAADTVNNLATSLETVMELGWYARIKWPNDVLIENRKVAGVLLESWQQGVLRCLVIGIGINLASHPPAEATRLPATSLAAELHGLMPTPTVEQAAEALSHAFAKALTWREEGGFSSVRDVWLNRAALRGTEIRVRLPNETLAGVFEDIASDGQLLLRTPSGLRRIAAGDVFPPETPPEPC